MGSFPPCRKFLDEHIKRVNYLLAIWKWSHKPYPQIPDPEAHGWTHVDNSLELVWYDGQMIPQELADIATNQDGDHNESGSESEDSDFDIDDMINLRRLESESDDDDE